MYCIPLYYITGGRHTEPGFEPNSDDNILPFHPPP